jgi:hypothetical protein
MEEHLGAVSRSFRKSQINLLYKVGNYVGFDEEMIQEMILELLDSNEGPRSKNRDISDEELCAARTASMDRCSRRKKPNEKFCGHHTKSQPFGTIDDEKVVDGDKKKDTVKHTKKYGKSIKEITQKVRQEMPSNIDTSNNLKVEVKRVIYEGSEYFLDPERNILLDPNTQKIYAYVSKEGDITKVS